MLQAANIDIFNPFVPNAHNSECQKIYYFLNLRIFILLHLGTNGLVKVTSELGRTEKSQEPSPGTGS